MGFISHEGQRGLLRRAVELLLGISADGRFVGNREARRRPGGST